MITHLVILTAVIFTSCILVLVHIVRKRRGPRPPGPKGLPLIGNALDFPSSHQWKTFAQWGDRWGDIVGNAGEEERYIFSSTNFCGGRRNGRLGSHSREKANSFGPQLEAATHQFLLRVLRRPESLRSQLRHQAASTILMLAYGYQVQEEDDPLVSVAEKAIAEASQALAPASCLVDMFPLIRHVPGWVPGFGWKKNVHDMAKTLTTMREMPFQFVKDQMAAGTAAPNFIAHHLEGKLSPEREQLIKDTASALYVGGSDTTVSALASFFLDMMRNPEVQRKAQLEIDSVVGQDRLPTLADRADLPYVEAICSEVMRLNPSAPIAFPHVLNEDDVHAGYVLPKGTTVIANTWRFCHDPRLYENPWDFNPERFISSEKKMAEQDPHDMVFGFGRRNCPGMHFADTAVFLTCAMSLAVFDISKPVVDGVVVEPEREMTSGIISHPKPFQSSIKPRSSKAEALILAANGL